MYAPQPQPRQINALSDFTVTKVACGQNHTLALTKEGQAFTWGERIWHLSTCRHADILMLEKRLCLQLYVGALYWTCATFLSLQHTSVHVMVITSCFGKQTACRALCKLYLPWVRSHVPLFYRETRPAAEGAKLLLSLFASMVA